MRCWQLLSYYVIASSGTLVFGDGTLVTKVMTAIATLVGADRHLVAANNFGLVRRCGIGVALTFASKFFITIATT